MLRNLFWHSYYAITQKKNNPSLTCESVNLKCNEADNIHVDVDEGCSDSQFKDTRTILRANQHFNLIKLR
jgi:hypothetical protein